MSKIRIYILGLITLLAFPLAGLSALYFIAGIPPLKALDFNRFLSAYTLLGFLWGVFYAFFGSVIFSKKKDDVNIRKQQQLLLRMNLNFIDKVFLSFCAGFGEEILFRSSIQHWLGIWITSVVFIAIHGYLNPKKPVLALYGLLLIPFIVSLGYGLLSFGIWFCIAAHMSYDLVLFLSVKEEKEKVFFRTKTISH